MGLIGSSIVRLDMTLNILTNIMQLSQVLVPFFSENYLHASKSIFFHAEIYVQPFVFCREETTKLLRLQ
jgi:hypothetical protein